MTKDEFAAYCTNIKDIVAAYNNVCSRDSVVLAQVSEHDPALAQFIRDANETYLIALNAIKDHIDGTGGN